MEVVNLKCNNCGADLKISRHVKFFTCTFCKSSLTIKKTGSVEYTEVLGKIETNTNSLLKHSETTKIEYEIARLDREWTIESDTYSTKSGGKPTTNGIGFAIGFVTVFLLMMAYGISIFTAPSIISTRRNSPVLPIFFFIFFASIFGYKIAGHYKNVKQYEAAEKEYKSKRAGLLAELTELE